METGAYRYSSSVSACDGPNIALRFLSNDAADPPTGCSECFADDDCWQQLEAFWGAEKHRCTHESPAFESSTESQLESRDFLSEPPKLPDERVGSTSQGSGRSSANRRRPSARLLKPTSTLPKHPSFPSLHHFFSRR